MRKNPTSARKKGDFYQELWCIKLSGDWLLNPNSYQWLHFELIPEETNQRDFYLDDIVALKENGNYDLYQTKHKQNPKKSWTWNELVSPLPDSKNSLLKKWANSLFRLSDKSDYEFYNRTDDAFFITNANASEEVTKYLHNELIDVKSLKKSDPTLYKSIENEIGDAKKIELFFKKFKFKFSQKSEDDFEEDTRVFFNETLCVTKAGFDNFLKWIRNRANDERTIKIEYEDIRRECEFDDPKALNEEFIIPEDFEFFDNQIHKSILEDLKKSRGGVKVIYGEPGAGKSVYLSKLDEQLNELGIISIKHHYHISPEDTNPLDRLNADRVIEAIKAQFKTHREELDELANINSKDLSLGKFISKVADKSVKDNKAFVIIIDGLDHPLKYGAEEELKTLLSEICLPQKGVWIVLGMQLVAKAHLPPVITERCPEQEWIKIKELSKQSVVNVLQKNLISLRLPTENQQKQSLVDKIYQITQGNPLHLRYTLQQLKNLNGNTLVTEYSCEDLIPYSGNIEQYYDSLWRQISDVAKSLLLTIVSVNFLFTKKQLIECISQTISNSSEVTNGFNLIAHLVLANYRKELSVYHNSFAVYLRKRSEYEKQKIVLRTNTKNWLASSGINYLQWAELKLIEHDLGNSTPLLDIDRDWLLESICNSSNSSQITTQLEKASKVAIEQKNFAKALNLSYLHNYYINLNITAEEARELIWIESFYQNTELFTYINFDELPSSTLPHLSLIAESKGDSKSIEAIIKILMKRLDSQEYRHGSIPSATRAVLEVITLDRTHSVKRVYNYILKFRSLEVTGSLLKIYTSSLLSLNQIQKLKELLGFEFTIDEKQVILTECAKYGFENKAENFSDLFRESNLSLLSLIYARLKNVPGQKLADLPSYDIFPTTLEEHDSEKRSYWRDLYRDNFLNGILYVLDNRSKEIEKWLSDAPNLWAINAMKSLFHASLLIGSTIPQSSIDYTDLFKQFKDIQELRWPEDRSSLNLQFAFSDSLSLIFDDLKLIKIFLENKASINDKEYNLMTDKPFLFNKDALLEITLNSNISILDSEVFKKIKDENIKLLEKSINYFPERASQYAKIAKLIRLYENEESSRPFLKKATDNLLGHGYHKDMYLFDVIDAIGFCAEAGMSNDKITSWISRIIPLVEHVGDYTDGDETHGLPFKLAELLAKQDKNLLYKDLFWATKKEDLYHAEKLFKILINSFTYSNELEISIACTALDRESFSLLKQQAQSNSGAKKALESIERYLGVINYPPENVGNSSSYTPSVVDYSTVKPNEILTYLESNFENKWQLINYLQGWTQYWITRDDKKKIYELNKKFLEKFGIQHISGEQLDALVPLAQEFDNSTAFDLLCNAQINDHGWQKYWTDEKKAERRWKIIKTQFPQRYMEFFQKSSNSAVPLSRGVEYLTLFEDLESAGIITEAGVTSAEESMADLKLPIVDWHNDKREIALIDLLLQRLLWPSTITQERAATAISRLLVKSEKNAEIFSQLLFWIGNQKMESTVAIGLLPILKTLYSVQNLSEVSFIQLRVIINSLKINSIVIEKLVEEISNLLNVTNLNLNLPEYTNIDTLPKRYEVTKFFSKHVSTFLPPIYMDRAIKIERRTGRSFIKLWSLTADKIVSESETVLNSNQVYYYGRNQHDEFLLGFSSKVSQAYRSAFLRVLQMFYKNGYIPEEFYLNWGYATLPVELSHWKIIPNRSPDWWPELKKEDTEKTESFSSLTFKKTLESLVNNEGKEYLIAAEGAIKPDNNWQTSSLLHSFSLIGFGYKVIGLDIPVPEEVAKEVLYAKILTLIPNVIRPFHFLENQNNFITVDDEYIQLKDLIIYPLIAREHDLCIGLWQYFRGLKGNIHVDPELTKNLKLKVSEDSWYYQNTKGEKIVMYKDWLEGLRERYHRNLPLHQGEFIMTNKFYLDEWLKQHDLRLGYVLKSVYCVKKYSYEKVQEYEEVRLINVSSIII